MSDRCKLVALSLLLLLLAVDLTARPQLSASTPCFHQARNLTGLCRSLPDCPTAVQELQENTHPQVCGLSGDVPDVCCPDDRTTRRPARSAAACKQRLVLPKAHAARGRRPGAVARQKCAEYVRFVCSAVPSASLMAGSTEVVDRCHYRVELISGGTRADPMEFPHMALLGYGNRKQADFACGGSLISPQYVLTAAHCRESRSLGLTVRWALLGTLGRTAAAQPAAMPQLLEVDEVIVHPNYRPHLRYHDIALLRLERPADMDAYVRPACLHTVLDGDPTGLDAIATGWGATGDAEDNSEHLLKVNLTVVEMEQCRSAFNATVDTKLPRGIVESQLCAGGDSQKDTCPGDSGGPLQLPTNDDPYCQYRVVGIVSFGPPCSIGLLGVYTRVSAYVPWIESVVWPDEEDFAI